MSTPTTLELSEFIIIINKKIKSNAWAELEIMPDDLLTLDKTYLVCYIRALYPVRSKLRNWNQLVSTIYHALGRVVDDPRALLKGIRDE